VTEASGLTCKADAEARIKELVKERAEGGPSRLREALKIAVGWGIREDWVERLFEEAERLAAEVFVASQDDFFKNTAVQPSVVEAPKSSVEEPPTATISASASKPWIRQFPKPSGGPALKPAPEVDYRKQVRKYGWSEVVIPKGVTEIEALTYVPGLVGQLVEWIVRGAIRPNRVMALGVALGVVGTLMGRRVEGPKGNATHLYIFILAPTGWGKDHPLWCGNKIMIAIGAKGLLGPSEFVSGRGIIKYLKRNPVTLCIVDELGDVFQLIHGQDRNPWVTDLIGHFKKLYNSWEIVVTAESMKEESVMINHPALSIVGAATPEAFFGALQPSDVESGFANRPMLLPFEGFERPPERDVPEGAEEPPAALVEELKTLLGRVVGVKSVSAMDKILGVQGDDVAPPVPRENRVKIEWGSEEAKAPYYEFSREIDKWQGIDRQRFELGMRAAENAVRCATIVAGGCFSPTVDVGDIEWALHWSRVSFEAAVGGINKYMRHYFEFPKFCQEVEERIEQEGGWMPKRDLQRAFRRHMKYGTELDKVLAHLVKEGRIRESSRKTSKTGPATAGWELVIDLEKEGGV
jgi:hypothetical protein